MHSRFDRRRFLQTAAATGTEANNKRNRTLGEVLGLCFGSKRLHRGQSDAEEHPCNVHSTSPDAGPAMYGVDRIPPR
jgi:hypothetical protein